MPGDNLDNWLYNHLQTVEDELGDICDSNTKMKSFSDRLAEIQRTAARALADNSLTARTTALIRSVSSTVAALARFASGVQYARVDIERKTRPRLEDAMAKLSLGNDICSCTITKQSPDSGATHEYLSRSHSAPKSPVLPVSDPSPLPPHVSRCYDWLLKNLHDPYPPATFRCQVYKDTGVSHKVICDWFTNTRRKIGWTEIWKRHFKKDRALTVDCARVVLLGERSKIPVSQELRVAFLNMKATAEKLFGDVLLPSDAVKHLDDLVAGHTSKLDQVGHDSLQKPSEFSYQHPNRQKEMDSRASKTRVLGKRRAPSYVCEDPATVSAGDSEGHQVKRSRTCSSTNSANYHHVVDSSQSAIPSDPVILPAPIKRQRLSSKRHRSDNDEPRPSKRCRVLSDSKDSSSLEASEVDGFDSTGSVSFDNTCAMIDSLTTSPSTSLLTFSDELIGSSSLSPSEGTFATTNSSLLSEIDYFKDLVDLPDMPTFTWNGSDILPPSFEPFPLSADFSVSHLEPNDSSSHCLPNLVDFGSSWLSSLESNLCLESGLDASLPNSTNIREPGSDAASFSDFLQEFFCSQDGHRSEQSKENQRSYGS